MKTQVQAGKQSPSLAETADTARNLVESNSPSDQAALNNMSCICSETKAQGVSVNTMSSPLVQKNATPQESLQDSSGQIKNNGHHSLRTGSIAESPVVVEPETTVKQRRKEPTTFIKDKQSLDTISRNETLGRVKRAATKQDKLSPQRFVSETPASECGVDAKPSTRAPPLRGRQRDHERKPTEKKDSRSPGRQGRPIEKVASPNSRNQRVVSHTPHMEVHSPAATRAPRVAGEETVFSDEGASGISVDKSAHSINTTGLMRPDMFSVGLVAFLGAAFVVIVLALMRLLQMVGSRGPALEPAAWIKDMSSQCNSPDCLSAVSIIAAAVDSSADPCTNFYAFTCGQWRPAAQWSRRRVGSKNLDSTADQNVSYLASLRGAYVAAANDSLWRVAQGSTPFDDRVNQMAQVYASCLAFFVNRPLNLTNAWQAASMYTSLWLQSNTFQDTFFVVVSHVLNSRLVSVVRVDYDSQGIHISPGTAILRHVKADFRHAIVTRAVKTLMRLNNASSDVRGHFTHSGADDHAIIENRVIEQTADGIVKLDDFVFNHTEAFPLLAEEVPLHDLDSPHWNWTTVLAAQASIQLKHLAPKALVTNPVGVRAILDSLSSQKNPLVAKIYLMLVPLAEFFALEERVRVHRRLFMDDVRYELCLTALETMFGEEYRRWMTTELAGSDPSADVRHILSGVLMAADMAREISRGVVLDYGRIVGASYPAPLYPIANSTSMTAMVDFGPDFVANAILFVTGGGQLARPLLDFDALSTDWSDREVAQRLLIPDFYYTYATPAVINYGTLGYYMARLAFQAGSPGQNAQNDSGDQSSRGWDLTEHTSCLASHVRRASSGLETTGDEPWWRDVVHVRWAAHVSYSAAVIRDTKVAEERALEQLFFLRLGHTFCATAGRTRRKAPAKALRLAAMTLPTFGRAFGCPATASIEC